ncbi:hypothetical protein D9M68_643670 [compost metagenome]
MQPFLCLRTAPQHDGNQLQAGRPAVRLVMDQAKFVRGEPQRVQVLLEEAPRLVDVEGQFDDADLGYLSKQTKATEAERGRNARRNNEMQIPGAVIQQLLNQLVHPRIIHVVIVVDDQVKLLGDLGGLAGHHGHHGIHRDGLAAFLQDVVFDLDPQPPECGKQVRAEDRQLPVFMAQGKPGHFGARLHEFLAPLDEKDGFSETGTAADQGDGALPAVPQMREQLLAGDEPGADARRRKLGRDKQTIEVHLKQSNMRVVSRARRRALETILRLSTLGLCHFGRVQAPAEHTMEPCHGSARLRTSRIHRLTAAPSSSN